MAKWDSPKSDPVSDILQAKKMMEQSTGVEPEIYYTEFFKGPGEPFTYQNELLGMKALYTRPKVDDEIELNGVKYRVLIVKSWPKQPRLLSLFVVEV